MSKQPITQKDLEDSADLDFDEISDHWNVYKLEDGTVLKIKLVLNGVKRLKKWKADGTPVYVVNTGFHVRALKIDKKLCSKPKTNTFKPI